MRENYKTITVTFTITDDSRFNTRYCDNLEYERGRVTAFFFTFDGDPYRAHKMKTIEGLVNCLTIEDVCVEEKTYYA